MTDECDFPESFVFERCCTSPSEVEEAKNGGAARAELCANLPVGGVTPSEGDICAAVATGLPVNVLIRPREGDFVYSEKEIGEMLSSIGFCRSVGVNGIVVGALTKNGDVDMGMMMRFIEAARCGGGRKAEVTFHRAFDVCSDPLKALEDIVFLGCDRLLTSGCKPMALEGAELIATLVARASGRVIVMPGSGVTPENVMELHRLTGATEFHGSHLCAYNG